jgi:hypothetical protein
MAAPATDAKPAAPEEGGGDWQFQVDDISDDPEALEADLKAGQVQATGTVGTLTGFVREPSGEAIPGAYVQVVGKDWMARTGLDGSYRLDLPPGAWTILAREELHEAVEQPDVKITANESAAKDFVLAPRAQALVVKVEADANVEGDAGVLLQRQQETASSDRMSREEITRSGGGSLANVARFIVGATVVDGRFVFVRGLGHRYGNTLLDGARVPSPEPELRTVPLDIFPSGALGAINVQKSFTPDVPGDFAGGSIQLVTREIPTTPTLRLGVELEANTATTGRPMLSSAGFGAADAFGFGNLPRGLSSEIPADKKVGTGLIDPETFQPVWTPEEVEKHGEAMFMKTEVRRGSAAPPNAKFTATFGNAWSTRHAGRFGILASANYANKYQTLRHVTRQYGGSGGTGELDTSTPQVDFRGKTTTQTVRWSALGLARWDITDDHRLELSSLYSRDAENEAREQRGTAPNVSGLDPIFSTRLRYVMRSVWFNRLGARHRFPIFGGKHRIQLDYFGSYSQARRDDPSMRSMLYLAAPSCDLADVEKACDGNLDVSAKGDAAGDLMFLGLVDHNANGALNFELPFDQWSGLASAFKFGAWAEGKWRDFGVRRFDYRISPGDVPSGTGNVINESTIGGQIGGAQPWVLRELTRSVDNYRASQELYAVYGMLTLPLAPWVRVSGGARVEFNDIRVKPYDLFAVAGAPPADCTMDPTAPECLQTRLKTVNALPSASVVFSPRLPKKLGVMNFRLLGSKTLARPEFRELAPFQFTDFVGGFTVQGNRALKQTEVWNAEARWEWFPSPSEVIAVTGFYKHFDRPIEQIANANTPPILSFTNARAATNLGAELELRKSLGFFAKKKAPAREILRRFGVGANFAYVYSRVDLLPPCYAPGGTPPVPPSDPTYDDYVERPGCQPGVDAVTSRRRPLQGQSPFVLNVFADYDHAATGTFVRVMVNTFGRRIFAVSTQGLPDIYEESVPALDVLFSQRLFGVRRSRDGDLRHELRLDLGAFNILNPRIRRTQGGERAVTFETRRGVSFAAGISWAL